MNIDKSKIDLNAPAFGTGAQTIASLTSETQTEDSQTKEEIKDSAEEKEAATSSADNDDEQKVPYSRFKSVHQRAIEAERLAQEAQDRYEQLRDKPVPQRTEETQNDGPFKGNLPSYWLKLYGDSAVSREAYTVELERQQYIKEDARREALEAVREERISSERQVNQNVQAIEEGIEDLSAQLGRDLTEDEQLKFLDIVDEYSPKDEDGNYASLLSFNKAWEIYELRKDKETVSAKKSRSVATSLTGGKTEGEPNSQIKDQEDFNPRDWNAYKRRLGK